MLERIRLLEPEEYTKLAEHPSLAGLTPSDGTYVVVAEDEHQQMIGYFMATPVYHLEPVWVDPMYRGSTLLSRLWGAMTRLLDAIRVDVAFSCADRPEIADYLTRLGLTPLPYATFVYDPHHKFPPVENHWSD